MVLALGVPPIRRGHSLAEEHSNADRIVPGVELITSTNDRPLLTQLVQTNNPDAIQNGNPLGRCIALPQAQLNNSSRRKTSGSNE